MISLLPAQYAKGIDKKFLIDLEREIIGTFEFELQYSSSLLYSQRLLKILGFSKNEQLTNYTIEFCEAALLSTRLTLRYKQSAVAAAAITCALHASIDPTCFSKTSCVKMKGLEFPLKNDHFSWWTTSEEIINITKLDLCQVKQCYKLFEKSLNGQSQALPKKVRNEIQETLGQRFP